MRFVFGDIIVDCEQVKLTKLAKHIECEPRVFDLLVYFCNHPQQAISRVELVTEVWAGRIVSDAAVNRAVGELRKLVEDNPSSPQWIKTVSKVGYQLAVTPTLITNQLTSNKQSTDIIQTKTIQADSTKATVDEVNFNENHLLKSKWFWLVIVFVLLIVFAYKVLTASKSTETFEVVSRNPLTFTMGNAFNASYNVKNSTLVYLHREDADSNTQIFIKKANNAAIALSQDDYYYTDVIYGADGFIYATRLNNLQQRHCEIVTIEPVTNRYSPIVDCGKGVVTQLVFDDKERRLIYRTRKSISEPYAIHSYQLNTGRKQQITHPVQVGNNTGDYIFAISPDNQTLAIVEYNSDDVDSIKLVDLNDNHIIANAPFIDNVSGLIWRSDNLILTSNSKGLFEFNRKDFTLVTKEHSDQFSRLALGADNHSILTERGQTTVNIFSYSKHQNVSKALTTSNGISLNPTLGNRSNILAFKSNRTGKNEIYIQIEGQAAFIAEFEGTIDYIGGMAWSPKDEQLVVSINSFLYLYSLGNNRWKRLAEHYTSVHQVAFVQESIMFSAEVDGQWNIWKLSLKNGQVEQVTTKGGYSVQGNSSKVYLTKFNHNGLYQLDLDTGIESIIIEGFPISGWRHWQLRDDKIYYLLDKKYKELNLITENEKVLHSFEGRTPISCNTAYQHDFFSCEQVELSTSNIWQFQLRD
jgi:transcriptional activator of cad operon